MGEGNLRCVEENSRENFPVIAGRFAPGVQEIGKNRAGERGRQPPEEASGDPLRGLTPPARPLAMRRADIVGRKRTQEAAFTKWLEADPARKAKYGEVLPSLSKAYDVLNATALKDLVVLQILQASDLLNIAFTAQDIVVAKEKPDAESAAALTAATARARERAKAALADRNLIVEREMLTFLLVKASELPEGQKIAAIEKRFGNLQGDARRRWFPSCATPDWQRRW